MKKPLRILLRIFGGFALLAVLLVGVAFVPAVQTWAVRRVLAGVKVGRLEVGRATVGLHSIHLENLHFTQPGLALAVPTADLDLSVWSGMHGNVQIDRLVAKGWVLDCTPVPENPAPAPAKAFTGLFDSLHLPFALGLEQVDLEGDVTRPEGGAHLVITGGGLGSGREGAFKIASTAQSSGPPAQAGRVALDGELMVRMDPPNSIQRFGLNVDATASDPKLPQGAAAHLTFSAARNDQGESYTISVSTAGKKLLDAKVDLPAGAAPFTGQWSVDATDAELAPFALGRALPGFNATGQGTATVSRDFGELAATGKLDGRAQNLEILRPELGALDGADLSADFDLMHRGTLTRVTRLKISVGGKVDLETLQNLELDTGTGELKAPRPEAMLARATLTGVPVAWAQPWLPWTAGNESTFSGVIEASARDQGFVLSVADFDTAGSLSADAGTIFRGELRAPAATIACSPHGWGVELTRIDALRPGAGTGADSISLRDFRIGQLKGQPLKLDGSGRFAVALFKEIMPVWSRGLPLRGGAFAGNFTAGFGAKKEYALKFESSKMVAASTGRTLPDVSIDLRAEVDENGQIEANIPIRIAGEGHQSELALGGTGFATATGWKVDARLVGGTVYYQDLAAFADWRATALTPVPTASAPAAPVPVWSGVEGTIGFDLKKVIYSATWQHSVKGTLKLEERAATLATSGDLGSGEDFTVAAGVTYHPGDAKPYVLEPAAGKPDGQPNATLKNFDTARLFPRTLEGPADFAVTLTRSQAATIGELVDRAQGTVTLTSKGGVCRLLSVPAGQTDSVSQAADAGISVVGTVVGTVAGAATGANAAGAIAEISDLLHEIRFDQLVVTVSRGPSQDLVLEDFHLISPDVRLAGHGRVKYRPVGTAIDWPMSLQLQLAARGVLGDTMKGAGLTAAKPDDLGYLPLGFDLPLLGGTLRVPDTNSFYRVLAARAVVQGANSITNGLKQGAGSLLKGLFQ